MRAVHLKTLTLLISAITLMAGTLRSTAQETLLIGWTDLWGFNDTTSTSANLHGTGWELAGYDTNSAPGWKTAPALFGNDGAGIYDGPGRPFAGMGLNGFQTPLNRSVAAASDRVTFYFRKKFNWSGSPVGVVLETKWVHDDGIVVYLNGTEVLRSKMQVAAPDPVTWDTLGANHDAGGFPPVVVEGFEYMGDLPSAALVTGENTIAVELHQSSTTSSDCSFAMELKGVIPYAPSITNAAQPANRIVLQNRSTTLSVFATASRPVSYQWYFQPAGGGGFSSILDATNSTYTIASMQSENAGDYYCTVSNPVGTVDSRTASVGYTTDSIPPTVARVTPVTFNSVIVEFSESMRPATVGGGLYTEDPFNYNLAGGTMASGVQSVVLNPGGASVTLTIVPDLEPDTDFTLDLSGDILDLADNQLVAVTIPFRSWSPTTSPGVIFEAFDTSSQQPPGNAVVNLTSHPSFPNNPRDVSILTGMDSRQATLYSTDANENYGARIRTLFIPPTSGNWILYLWADDGAQLFFNPTGPGETGKQLLLNRTTCCGDFNLPGSRSAPQNLTGGQAYYVEALYKEGIGGDYGKVIALREGQPVPGTGDAGLLAPVAAPAGIAGTFTINQPPSDQNAVPNSTVTFSVGTTTDVPLSYQWMRDGVEIPNAAGASSISARYSFFATAGDTGARFSVRVSIIGGPTITSPEALLTVAPDTIRPTVVSVSTTAAGTSVVVTYSEGMGASADLMSSYSINGAAPTSVTRTSSTVFTLTPATVLQDCVANILRITGAADTSGNLINPNPTSATFTKPQTLVALGAAWRYEDSGNDLLTAWSGSGFNDGAWLSGPAPLGFEPAATQVPPVATPISSTITNKTAYFRIHFTLATAPGSVTRLQLTEVLDDGAVYYLNGIEAWRTRMPAGPVAAATLASGGGPEPTDGTHTVEGPTDIPTAGLVYGDNVLAVEVHPSSATSSDSIFAAELTATISACVPPLVIARSGSNQATLTWPEGAFPGYRLESAPTPTGPWGPQAGSSGVAVSTASGNLFFRLTNP